MKESVIALLIRKTEESRAHAQTEITKWHETVELAQKAESMAECNLYLPPLLTSSISEAAEEVCRADYLTALGLSERAASSRAELIKSAHHILEVEVKARQENEEKLAKEIKSLKWKGELAVSKIHREFDELIGNKPELSSYLDPVFSLGCVWLIGATIVAWLALVFLEFSELATALVFASIMALPVLVSLLVYGIHLLSWRDQKLQKEVDREVKLSQAALEINSALKLLEVRQKASEREREKAEAALNYFLEHTEALR